MATTSITDKKDASAILHLEMAETWRWRIDTDPELAAALGLLSSRRSSHAVDPRSLASFEQRLGWMKAALSRVTSQVDRSSLNDKKDQLSYDLYVKQLEDYVTFTPLHKAYLCCVNRLEGPQTDLPLMAKYLPVKTADQRAFYLKFLRAVPVQLSEITELLQQGLAESRTPPQISLDGVVPQIRGMVEGKCEAFKGPIKGVFPEEESDTEAACMEQIDGSICSAFGQLADFLETTYIPQLRTEISAVKGYPNGETYYKDCLEFHTTTTMTPEDIHQLGLDEVRRVKLEMETLAAEEGYGGRLPDYLEHLRTSPDYEAPSAEALCALFRDVAGRISPALLRILHLETLPRMPFSIIETPAAHASMAPAAYYLAGSADATAPRPGIFYVNTSELPTRRTYEAEALALHEAIPGHHTQAAIQAENPDLPDFRRFQEDRRYFEAPCRFPFYTGYIEGWGLHSETLGKELGLYTENAYKMGQLSMEALRSCRLVVDTGMHAFGWSREQALQFMLDHTAMGEHDAATEVARYITWPGQATAYKVGERHLHRLRTMAEGKLKDKFDPRDFYSVVLECGAIPLDTLERLVDAYIDAIQSGQSIAGSSGSQAGNGAPGMGADFMESMTFANWCKCCVVPGSCGT